MPEHVLMSEIEIITDGGRRRRWSANDKLRIVEEKLEEGTSEAHPGGVLVVGQIALGLQWLFLQVFVPTLPK